MEAVKKDNCLLEFLTARSFCDGQEIEGMNELQLDRALQTVQGLKNASQKNQRSHMNGAFGKLCEEL